MTDNNSTGQRNISESKNLITDSEYSYEDICSIRDFLQGLTDIKPKVGIICGSGLGYLTELISNADVIMDYPDIPNFPKTTAPGHLGKIIFGYISEVPVVCMQGRYHYYEGYSLSTCVMPVRLMKLLGITFLIVTNAAGSLNQTYKVGDIMLQKDHFNIMGLAGHNPLRGLNDPRWGRRFVSMVNAYDSDILNIANEIAKEMGIAENVHEGVYSCAGGPTYETVVECRALKQFGIDAMGMSTIHEVIAARHSDVRCFAFSLITNICPLEYEDAESICEDQVLEIGDKKKDILKHFVQRVVKSIGQLRK